MLIRSETKKLKLKNRRFDRNETKSKYIEINEPFCTDL